MPASSPQRGPSLTPARPAPSLEALARQRYRLNPDVPGSLREGLEETIIINRLGVTDGIPAIDRPRFHRIADADFLTEREPVLVLQLGDDARAYPLLILVWHEIVNDTVDGVPVAVTYCPLCNSAFA